MHKPLLPQGIHPLLAPYSHGIEVAAGSRLVFSSGELGIGIGVDAEVPEDCGSQTQLCFDNIEAVLPEAGWA